MPVLGIHGDSPWSNSAVKIPKGDPTPDTTCDEPGPTRPLVNIPSLTGNTGQNAPSLSCSFGRSIRPPYWDSPLFPSSLSIHHTGRAGIISPIQTSVTRSYFEIIQLHSITATQLNHSVISPNALLHTALYRQKLSYKLL